MAEPLGLFCLEANWDWDRRYSGSIKPVIELLKNMDLFDLKKRPPIYRDVCTYAEFEKLIDEWARYYRKYRVAYIASHGSEGQIVLDEDDPDAVVSLEELADLLEGRCYGRVLFLGGCATMHIPRREVQALFKETRARAICGYEKSVDTIHAAALEAAFFGALADAAWRSNRIGTGLAAFKKTRFYQHIGPELGFWIWHER